MLIVLSDEHKTDLAFLKELPYDFFAEFCRLAMGFLRKGDQGSKKMFTGAAKKLGVSPSVVENGVLSLCFVWAAASKQRLMPQELSDSLAVLAMDAEKSGLVVQLYNEHSVDLRSQLSSRELQLPHLAAIDWRLDVLVAQRSMRSLAMPQYLLELRLKEPPRASDIEEKERNEDKHAVSPPSSSNGAAASPQDDVPQDHEKRILLQTDVTNLRHLAAELEAALGTVKQSYARRVDRNI